ncbi:MAG: hypothetical protein IKL68_03925 [Clostridia bacterium]|nr:hypothetical protein [Clostridia bacterium]
MKHNLDGWSDDRPYYMIYQDKYALKNIYAQLNIDPPDVGLVSYIGANTKRRTRDYSMHADYGKSNETNHGKENHDGYKEKRRDKRGKLGASYIDADESSIIREYANIQDIKEMNNMLFYRKILRGIIKYCGAKDKHPICYIKSKIELYEEYNKEEEDIFVKMKNDCIWLKKNNMQTSAANMAKIMGEVCLVGYVIEEASADRPRIIKALVIYT